jgi:hypothetical protein
MASLTVESDAASIYEGGGVFQITLDELEKNPTAIKQLINNHNLLATDLTKRNKEIQEQIREIEFLKASPFVAIIGVILSTIGAALISIGVNLTNTSGTSDMGWGVVVLAGVIILTGACANVMYPYVRSWFNSTEGDDNA